MLHSDKELVQRTSSPSARLHGRRLPTRSRRRIAAIIQASPARLGHLLRSGGSRVQPARVAKAGLLSDLSLEDQLGSLTAYQEVVQRASDAQHETLAVKRGGGSAKFNSRSGRVLNDLIGNKQF